MTRLSNDYEAQQSAGFRKGKSGRGSADQQALDSKFQFFVLSI